jgi:hypothetical protein
MFLQNIGNHLQDYITCSQKTKDYTINGTTLKTSNFISRELYCTLYLYFRQQMASFISGFKWHVLYLKDFIIK